MLERILVVAGILVLLATQTGAQDRPTKNPFAQPGVLKQQPVSKRTVATGGVTVEQPVPALKLTATLISVAEPMAIVNGQFLHIGDEIEGMRLSLIDEGRAVFRFNGRSYAFTIDGDPRTQTR